MDSRIGVNSLKASMGFGGSCLKKDILSLIYIFSSKNLHIQANYWSQVILMNEYQRIRMSQLIANTATIDSGTVSILGLSFKGNTNDTRGTNAIFLISYLLNCGISLNLYDPLVSKQDIENELKLYNSDLFESNNLDLNNIKQIKLYDDL